MRQRRRCASLGDKVPAEVRSDIEAKVAEVKEAAQGEDVEKIKSARGVGADDPKDRGIRL
jgi:hypothetical protein